MGCSSGEVLMQAVRAGPSKISAVLWGFRVEMAKQSDIQLTCDDGRVSLRGGSPVIMVGLVLGLWLVLRDPDRKLNPNCQTVPRIRPRMNAKETRATKS